MFAPMSDGVTMDRRLAERNAPAGRPAMFQRWEDLLFLHWKFPTAEIQRTLPKGLTVDTFQGDAWLGVVPFFMRAVRPAWLPPMPWFSYFLELNLRTYVVDAQGRPGVWFYSLDCNRRMAVWLARTIFHLPYENAAMRADRSGTGIAYKSQRRGADASSHFVYEPGSALDHADPGSLEFFLVERYRLFARGPAGRLRSGRVHHAPYQLARAEVPAWRTDLFSLNGFEEPAREPDHSVCSPGVSVNIYALGD